MPPLNSRCDFARCSVGFPLGLCTYVCMQQEKLQCHCLFPSESMYLVPWSQIHDRRFDVFPEGPGVEAVEAVEDSDSAMNAIGAEDVCSVYMQRGDIFLGYESTICDIYAGGFNRYIRDA